MTQLERSGDQRYGTQPHAGLGDATGRLTQLTGRAVRDKTGLTGRNDFAMKTDPADGAGAG